MNRAYISIGSNIDRKKSYLKGLQQLARLGTLVSISSVYDTRPIGATDAENFYNGAVLLETELSASDLKRALQLIESEMGRVRTADRNAPRPIDLDIALFNQDQIDDADLKIPDPLILERPFIALSLAEISPEYVHPIERRTLKEIARTFGRKTGGIKINRTMTTLAKKLENQTFAGEIIYAR